MSTHPEQALPPLPEPEALFQVGSFGRWHEVSPHDGPSTPLFNADQVRAYALAALTPQAPAELPEAHPDDVAVDHFAGHMKWKLARARDRGKHGWKDRSWTAEQISQALREHVQKGDPIDVANYCMFLAARGEPITPQPEAATPEESSAVVAAEPVPAPVQPAYPEGDVVGPCVCGSWPGGKCLRCEWRPATPPVESVERDAALPIPPEIAAIAERLHTQDNRITQDPLFAVQQKRRIYGMDAGYCDNAEWLVDGETWAPEDDEAPPDGACRVGFIDKWEFVTGCLTEQGCKDFIACNGHNLHEPRIYAYGSYRNAEWIALRKWLMSLRPAAADREKQP